MKRTAVVGLVVVLAACGQRESETRRESPPPGLQMDQVLFLTQLDLLPARIHDER